MASNFIVITADIIDSKKSSVKVADQSLERLNNEFDRDLAAYFKLYRGDEIQCVARPCENIVRIIRSLRFYLYPLKIRIGIGKGSIDNTTELINSKLENTNPWENNGPAFHNARKSLEYLENSKKLAKKSRTYFMSESGDTEFSDICNSLLILYDIAVESWTHSQWECIQVYEKCRNLEETSRFIGKTYQSVQRSISKAQWDEIKYCESRINELIIR